MFTRNLNQLFNACVDSSAKKTSQEVLVTCLSWNVCNNSCE